jgi:hypothetical protein
VARLGLGERALALGDLAVQRRQALPGIALPRSRRRYWWKCRSTCARGVSVGCSGTSTSRGPSAVHSVSLTDGAPRGNAMPGAGEELTPAPVLLGDDAAAGLRLDLRPGAPQALEAGAKRLDAAR